MGGNGARSATSSLQRQIASLQNQIASLPSGAAFTRINLNNQLNALLQQAQAQGVSVPNQQPPQPQPQSNGPTQTGATSLAAYQSMSNADVANYLSNLKNTVSMPAIDMLPDSDTQRLTYDLGLNAKPTVVREAEFSKVKGDVMYRGVQAAKDSQGNYIMTAQNVADNLMFGDTSRIGAGISGDGYYFTSDKNYANSYAGRSTNIRDGAVIRAKIDTSKAKIVTRSQLMTMFRGESGSVQRAFTSMSTVDNMWSTGYLGAYALYKGYNCISRPEAGHTIPLDRGIIVVCEDVKPRV